MNLIKLLLFALILTLSAQSEAKGNIIEKYSYKVSGKFTYYLGAYLPQEVIDFIKYHPHIASATIITLFACVGYQTFVTLPYLYKSAPFLYKIEAFLNSDIEKNEMYRVKKMYDEYEYEQLLSDLEQDAPELDLMKIPY